VLSLSKVVYLVVGALALGTLFVEMWMALFGRISASPALAVTIAVVCGLLGLIAISQIDPPVKK